MIKRVYTAAKTVETGYGFSLELDGKPVRTPAGAAFVLPTRALAEAIAAEWNAQGDDINPHTMPLMQLASTAIDRIAAVRVEVVSSVAGYGRTDLLCHREADGTDLAHLQAEHWQPLLDWLASEFGIALITGEGIMPITQDESALDSLRRHILVEVEKPNGDMILAGLAELTGLLGSVVLALAVFHGRLDAETAYRLSHLDETYQEEQWGQDSEALKARAKRRGDILAADRFLALLRA